MIICRFMLDGAPAISAIKLGGDLWMIHDNAPIDQSATILTAAAAVVAFPPRIDLPLSHPLRGERAFPVVPSGERDIIMGVDGDPIPTLSAVSISEITEEKKIK